MMQKPARPSATSPYQKVAFACGVLALFSLSSGMAFAQAPASPAASSVSSTGKDTVTARRERAAALRKSPAPAAAPASDTTALVGAAAGIPPQAGSPAAVTVNQNIGPRDPFAPAPTAPVVQPTPGQAPGMHPPGMMPPIVESAPPPRKLNMECLDVTVKEQGKYLGKIQERYVWKMGSRYCFDTEPPSMTPPSVAMPDMPQPGAMPPPPAMPAAPSNPVPPKK